MADRFDGNDSNGWVLEQGGRLYYVFTIDMASPNATSATLRIYEHVNATSAYATASQADYLTIANGASSFTVTVDLPPSVTGALTGGKAAYYYDLEVTFDTDTTTTTKYAYGLLPWRREPGGAT